MFIYLPREVYVLLNKFWRKICHYFTRNKMPDVQDFLSAFGDFLRFYVIFGYIVNENHWENARLTIIHVYFSA